MCEVSSIHSLLDKYENNEGKSKAMSNEEHNRQQNSQGRHTGGRVFAGVFKAGANLERCFLIGVSGRMDGEMLSARRINCIARSGEPGDDPDLTECGLEPPGVETRMGIGRSFGSGVRGGRSGGSSIIE